MIRTQIQLTEEQAKRLRDVAAADGRSMADVIRESVDAYLAETPLRRSVDVLRAQALALIGRYDSGLAGLGIGSSQCAGAGFSSQHRRSLGKRVWSQGR